MVDLVRDLEVSKRTVERDIEVLRDFFRAPIAFDRKRCGYIYEDPDFCLDSPDMRLTEGEFIAMFVAHRLMGEVSAFPGHDLCRRAMEKLAGLLPSAVPEKAEQIDQIISFGIPALRGDPLSLEETCARISGAIQERRTITVRYYSASARKETTRLIDPYHLRYSQSAWYLVGYCHTRKEVRTFAVDRMSSLGFQEETFEIPEGFSLEDYFGKSWRIERGEPFKARVRFSPQVARYIQERQWHPSQQVKMEEDGCLVASFEVDGWGEFKRWVLGFGGEATVLEPQRLAREIIEEAWRLVNRYGLGPGDACCPGGHCGG
jgi:predicted DNA-binding transcriptional regulator YafY